MKATNVQVFLSRDVFVIELTPMCPTSKQLQPAHEKKSSGNVSSMRRGSSLRRCVCAAGTCG